MIYVSLPYTHPDKDIVVERYALSCIYSAKLLKQGHIIQSPISIGHAIAEVVHDLPTDFDFWKNFCLSTLSVCNEMHVLKLDGWTESTGVAAEIEYAQQHGIKIVFVARDQITSLS